MNTIASPQRMASELLDDIRDALNKMRRGHEREVAKTEAERRKVLSEIEAPVELKLEA